MEIKRLKTKGETMIERAESQFLAYDSDIKDFKKDLMHLYRLHRKTSQVMV